MLTGIKSIYRILGTEKNNNSINTQINLKKINTLTLKKQLKKIKWRR